MAIHKRRTTVVIGILALLGCGPPGTTDLEILGVTAEMGATLGEQVALAAQVRNNGRDRATVSAATTGDTSMGLIRKGPPLEIRGGRTETLTLDLPADRPFIEACEFTALVFLARPGEPPNLVNDLWTDSVPENHSREIRLPIERPLPAELEVDEPIREVVDATTRNELTRHYAGTARILPVGSTWAIRQVLVQTQTALGVPVELLDSTLSGNRLTTGRVTWTGSVRERDSVARAHVRAEYVDCAGAERTVDAERIAVELLRR